MAKSELEKIVPLYGDLMSEVKFRIAETQKLRQLNALSPLILYESCYLQLRIICESIAIGCLLAHGDIPASRSKNAFKKYQADWIIRMLSQVHRDFYPVAQGEETRDADGGDT